MSKSGAISPSLSYKGRSRRWVHRMSSTHVIGTLTPPSLQESCMAFSPHCGKYNCYIFVILAVAAVTHSSVASRSATNRRWLLSLRCTSASAWTLCCLASWIWVAAAQWGALTVSACSPDLNKSANPANNYSGCCTSWLRSFILVFWIPKSPQYPQKHPNFEKPQKNVWPCLRRDHKRIDCCWASISVFRK